MSITLINLYRTVQTRPKICAVISLSFTLRTYTKETRKRLNKQEDTLATRVFITMGMRFIGMNDTTFLITQ